MNQNLFYSFDMLENPNDNYKITGLKLKKEINTLSSLTISCTDFHPLTPSIKRNSSIFTLAASDVLNSIFIGKVVEIKRDILSRTMEIECEDILGYLRDEARFSLETTGDVFSYTDLLRLSLYDGLSGADECIGINIGDLRIPSIYNYSDGNDSEKLSELNRGETMIGKDCLSILYDTVLNYTGAIVKGSAEIHYHDTVPTISISADQYVSQYLIEPRDAIRDGDGNLDEAYIDSARLTNYDFQFGNNLINITKELSQKEPFSTIVGYGNYIIGDVEWTVYSQTLTDTKAVVKYGYIVKGFDFGTVAKFNEGYDEVEALDIAKQNINAIVNSWGPDRIKPYADKYTVTGIDKFYLNSSVRGRPLDICDIVHIYVNETYDIIDYCLSMDVDFFNHENDTYIIGPYIPDNILDYKAGTVIEYNDKKRKTKNKRKK